MLIGFRVENWKSFRSPVSFSMVKTRERQHGERIPRIGKDGMGVLPVAAIYGGNASGKTNLFSAISFMKRLVVKQRAPEENTGVTPFLLSDETRIGLTKFAARILTADDLMYELSFSLDEKHVEEEKLVRVDGEHEQVLYQRKAGRRDPMLSPSLGEDRKRLKVIFEGTQDNQLFITNSIFQKCDTFRQVYDWFDKILVPISHTAEYLALEKYVSDAKVAQMLEQLDTGVVGLGSNDVDMSSQAIKYFQKALVDGRSAAEAKNRSGSRFVASKAAEGGLSIRELVTHHRSEDGNSTVDFHMSQESDGTQRLMDLLPAFLDVSAPFSRKVYIVDELDRSLHTLLTRALIESYLGCCSTSSRSQFVFTTHDALLMDQRLLRRDEIWVTERKSDGSSNLFSFSDYKDARKDKDIRKSYLQGRLGGVPHIFLDDMFGCPSPEKPDEAKDRTK